MKVGHKANLELPPYASPGNFSKTVDTWVFGHAERPFLRSFDYTMFQLTRSKFYPLPVKCSRYRTEHPEIAGRWLCNLRHLFYFRCFINALVELMYRCCPKWRMATSSWSQSCWLYGDWIKSIQPGVSLDSARSLRRSSANLPHTCISSLTPHHQAGWVISKNAMVKF
jgi:hypothetical protein